MVTSIGQVSAGVDDSVTITVASVPAGHPYIAQVTSAAGIAVLPDPPVPGQPHGIWWPSPILNPGWIVRNRDHADLLHIHFGTESFPPGHLTAVIAAAHHAGWPVLYTAHDLQHPQLRDQSAYRSQLEELVTGADAVITLTEGAASVIRETWAREVVVIPHPSVFDRREEVPVVRASEEIRIGTHLKDLRPNVDGPGAVAVLLDAVDLLRAAGVPAVAEVRLHHTVRDEAAREGIRRLCAGDPSAHLIEHDRLTDRELAVALSRLDVCLLPYRHGTHSGWLELCWDLGVPVVTPDVGFYAEQHPDGSVATFHPADPAGLANTIFTLLEAPDGTRSGSTNRAMLTARRRVLRQVTDGTAAAAHAALYRSLVMVGSRAGDD